MTPPPADTPADTPAHTRNHTTASRDAVDQSVKPVWILVALTSYTAVMVALTTLKAFYRIGYLWNPANQRRRGLSLIPFDQLRSTHSWFGPVFEFGGNIAFFVPFGILIYVLLYRMGGQHPIRNTVIIGAFASILMETAQYVFALGYTDIDDLMMNTLGALIGAGVAKLCGVRFHKVWVWLAIALGVIFAILVGLGDRLGDPNKVVDV